MQERRRPADQLDPVDDPGVRRAGGAAVAQVDAVVELGDLVLGKAPVGHEPTVARIGRRVHAGHGVEYVLGVLGITFLDHAAVRNAHRGWRLPRSQAQSGAGLDRLVQLHATGRLAFAIDGGGGQFDGVGTRPGVAAGAHQEHQGSIADHVVRDSTQRSWLATTVRAKAPGRGQAEVAAARKSEGEARGLRAGRR